MKNQAIYDAALRLLAESTVAGEAEDYEERAPYLLAAFCTEMSELDNKLRNVRNEATGILSDTVLLPLDSDFPLSPRFTVAASLYLAAMLILDSDEDRSDTLYGQYSDAVSRIADSIPATLTSIVDKYF